jgi:hypothetical protein
MGLKIRSARSWLITIFHWPWKIPWNLRIFVVKRNLAKVSGVGGVFNLSGQFLCRLCRPVKRRLDEKIGVKALGNSSLKVTPWPWQLSCLFREAIHPNLKPSGWRNEWRNEWRGGGFGFSNSAMAWAPNKEILPPHKNHPPPSATFAKKAKIREKCASGLFIPVH